MEDKPTDNESIAKQYWWVIVIIVLGCIAFVKYQFSKDDEKSNYKPTYYTSDQTSSPDAGTWVTVFEFKGNGRKKSAPFHLVGNEQKLVYKYNSHNAYAGLLMIYVVDKGYDILKTGGVPEITTNSIKEQSDGQIQKQAGDYYLDVNAVGSWLVQVMEKQ